MLPVHYMLPVHDALEITLTKDDVRAILDGGQLKGIELFNFRISSGMLKGLGNHLAIEYLDLSDNPISDETLREKVSKLTELKRTKP